ncbi:hypothetical protein, partial [Enterococcus raffinosus]
VNFILQKRLPFLYGFFHLHKIFYTLKSLDISDNNIAIFDAKGLNNLYEIYSDKNTDVTIYYSLVFRK